MLNDKIISDIASAYHDIARKFYSITDQLNKKDISALVNAAFYASLKCEEGRNVSFSLVLTDTINWHIEGQAKIPQKRIEFEQARELRVDNIVKLAGAFLSSESALMVRKNNSFSSSYEIWGVMYFNRIKSEFTELNISHGSLNYSRPTCFMINVYNEGSFTISCADSKVGQLVDGEFVRVAPLPFLGGGMTPFMEKFYDTSTINNCNADAHYFRLFSELLKEASLMNHGGLIIIVNATDDNYKDFCEFKYSFKVNHINVKDMFSKYTHTMAVDRTQNFNMNRVYWGNELQKRLKRIARLANIDGALIIDNNLNVISFGTVLKGKTWEGKILVGNDGFNNNGQAYDISKHGTKHKSALNFVGSCPNAIAFVLSEDGPIRGLVKKE